MAGRTQCEAEQIHRKAAATASAIYKVVTGGNFVASRIPSVVVPVPVAIAGGAVAGSMALISFLAGQKANAFAIGCRQEIYEQARKDAAAAANGTAAGGSNGQDHGVEHGRHLTCQEVYITTGARATTNERGDIVLTGGYFSTFCVPIVFDLDGDGVEYISISSGIYTDEEGDGRSEGRAWLGPDDGMLFYDEDGDGIGTHHEAILTNFVEGAATDLEALRAFDSNKDGVVDSGDALYASLKIGRDLNRNGRFEANEVYSLAQAGVARINLHDGVQAINHPLYATELAPGVVEFNRGQFVRNDGTLGSFADVGLEERAYVDLDYAGPTATVISYGGAKAWVQTGAGGVAVNLATSTYAGYYNFIDFIGGAGNDIVVGSEAGNFIAGGGGFDTLSGNGGDDVIVADAEDFASGWAEGGSGNDALIFDGATGLVLDASSRSFEMVGGGSGNDSLWVSSSTLGADGVMFLGGEGNDNLTGGAGNDFLIGGAGGDRILAGDGDDGVFADWEDLAYGDVQGGSGFDIITFQADYALDFDAYAHGFEIVYGGGGGDWLHTSSTGLLENDVVLYGHGGNDVLVGGGGNDFLVGGPGSDRFDGGLGDDIIVIDRYDALADVNGGGGTTTGGGDSLIFDDTTSLYITNLYTMNFRGVVGGDGNDTIYASRTDSLYYMQKSDNFLAGGKGDDFLYGGAGQDVYTWSPGDGNDIFSDRDYGEYRGDVVHLGEGVAPGEVTIRNVGGMQSIHVSGVGAGSMQLIGFAAAYGAADMLVVAGVAYDLKSLLASASLYGNEGILLTTRLPASYGDGGGYVIPPAAPPLPPPRTGNGTQIPPIVLDLDGDGFELIAAKKSGIYFDWDGDGVLEETGWAGPDDGFLVLDRDGDGRITHADEIAFGVKGGKKDPFMSDLEGLRAFDTDGNGSLDPGDTAFGQFGVWRDLDSDASVDPGELQSLAATGLSALSLDGYQTGAKMKPNENFIYATTNAVLGNRTIDVADVFLAYDDRPISGGGHHSMLDASLVAIA
jgi:Ca2+-binding RTX toxin-like protein